MAYYDESQRQIEAAGQAGEAEGRARGRAEGAAKGSAYGTAGGAIAGAALGSVIPGVGTAIGASLGGALGGALGGLFGGKSKAKAEARKAKRKAQAASAKDFARRVSSKKKIQVSQERLARASLEQANIDARTDRKRSEDQLLAQSMAEVAGQPTLTASGGSQLNRFEQRRFGG